jgi:hypothetical protein
VAPPVVNPGNPTTFFTATYEWANLKAGTYLIASGSHPAVQLPMGLYAALKVDVVAGLQAYPNATTTSYANDVVLLLSEVDPALNAAVVGGDYGTSVYPTSISMGYTAKYFLINGASYAAGAPAIAAGSVGGSVLLRFLNAGLRTRSPLLQGGYMTVVAEDGNPLPHTTERYVLDLPAGKTIDAISHPTATGLFPIYDRSMGLVNDMTSPGGMLTYLSITLQPGKIGFFRNGQWHLDVDGNYAINASDIFYPGFGIAGDLAVAGDWDGDGITEIGVFRNGQWRLDVDNNGVMNAGDIFYPSFGIAGDLPIAGDWDGDGITEIGVFRNGQWRLDVDNNGVMNAGDVFIPSFGMAGDLPVTEDWNGDGVTEIGVFRNGQWRLDTDGNRVWTANDTFIPALGLTGDQPVTGNW